MSSARALHAHARPATSWPAEGLAGLDSLRRRVIRAAWLVPPIANAMRQKDARIAVLASVSVLFAFGLTIGAPSMLFVLGPALLGVFHVASDVRYLVVRPRVPRQWLTVIALGCGGLVLLRLAEIIAPHALPFARLEVLIGWGWPVVGVWMGASGRPKKAVRILIGTALFAVPLVLAARNPVLARAALAYAHNVVALLIWVVLFRRRARHALLPLALVAGGAVALLAGLTLPVTQMGGPWADRLVSEALEAMPNLPQRFALSVALSYVFLQAVHYSVWVTWIPQEETRPAATLTFGMSLRSAKRDFGRWGLSAIAFAALVVLAASFVDVHRTRGWYLSVVTFHAYLEIACLAFLTARSRGSSLEPRES